MSTTKAERDKRLRELFMSIRKQEAELVELLRSGEPETLEDHALQGQDGEVRLSELFGDHDELMVIHNMGKGCAYCTLWADGFNGVVPHLENRAGFVVVSPDTPEVQAEFAASRGWTFRMASASESSFTKDLGFAYEQNGKEMVMPGASFLRKTEDGQIQRTAQTPLGPGDNFCAVWHLFELLPKGVNDWQPKFSY